MEKMDVDEDTSQVIRERMMEVENLWSVINEPAVEILTNLAKTETKSRLITFLESLKNSDSVKEIIIPPKQIEKYGDIKEKYREFSIWIFGVLFVTTEIPSKEIVEGSISIQASLLEHLSWYHLPGLHLIFNEYLSIIDELLYFSENQGNLNEIIIKRFNANPQAIENLDLTSYPMTVKAASISNVLLSVIKIIVRSNVEPSFYGDLWIKISILMNHSDPAIKTAVLPLISHLIKLQPIELLHNDNLFANMISYFGEIMEIISNQQDRLSLEIISVTPQLIEDAFEYMYNDALVIHLYFTTLEMIYSKIITSEKLERITCIKIQNYLTKNPRYKYTPEQLNQFAKYFDRFGVEFFKVLALFVVSDVKNLDNPRPVNIMRNCSILWDRLQNILMEKINTPVFLDHLEKLLYLARLIVIYLSSMKIRIKFFEDYPSITEILFQSISTENADKFFLCFVHLMVIDPFNLPEYQNVVIVPLLPSYSHKELTCFNKDCQEIETHAKTLDITVKIKCLEGVCQFGKGKDRINIVNTFIIGSNDIQSGEIAMSNSVFLLKDSSITFTDIHVHILRPGYLKNKDYLRVIVKILGPMLCILSGKGEIISLKCLEKENYIHCEVCDDNSVKHNFSVGNFIRKKEIEGHLRQYFQFNSKDDIVVRNLTSNLIRYSNHLTDFNIKNDTSNWLELLRHPDHETRQNLTNSIEVVLENRIQLHLKDKVKKDSEDWPKELENFIDVKVIGEITKAMAEAMDNGNDTIHLTLLDFVKNFARVKIWFTESRICNVFILTILNPNSSLLAVNSARYAYAEVAKIYGLAPKELFIRYKRELMLTIMGQVAQNFYDYDQYPMLSLHRLAGCIGYHGTRHFLQKYIDQTLASLVPLAVRVPSIQTIFSNIAWLLNLEINQMFINSFSSVCSELIITKDVKVAIECLHFISKMSEVSLKELFAEYFRKILRELLIHFHEKQSKVLKFINIISKFDSDRRQTDLESPEDFVNYLSIHLHAILVHFDSTLNSPSSDDAAQRSTLASLASLMKFMGSKYLAPLKYQILSILRSTEKFRRVGFPNLICHVWDSFIHNIALNELGPILPTICVSLMLLIDYCPDKVNSMLEYLLVKNKSKIKNYISEIFFINDLNVSNEIKTAVMQSIEETTDDTDGFEDRLTTWLGRIIHKTDEIKLKALIYLRKFLEQSRNDLNKMILNDTNHVETAIVSLLDTLIAGCQDSNEEIRYQCGECLGELGAIEPSLLPRRINSREDDQFINDINRDFAFVLLNEFVQSFQVQNNATDSFSLAIQEILKSYQISPTGANKNLWNSLPESTKKIIHPFLTSRYFPSAPTESIKYPIYGTEAGSTFEKWIFSWISSMISSVTDKLIFNMLSACKPAFRHDIKCCIFCIPYIVIYTIINGDKYQQDGILNEVFAVINAPDVVELENEVFSRQPLCYEEYTKKASDDPPLSEEMKKLRYRQVIFAILDYIRRWLGEMRTQKNAAHKAVNNFFSKLNNLSLAESCFQSHEYHRALMYLESHMTINKKNVSDPIECNLLTKIYTQLGESDGVSGILSSQNQPPSLQQLVLSHEMTGNLQDAAICFEKLVQKNTDTGNIQGMIQCYLGLEQPFVATNLIKGLAKTQPEMEPFINNESFWRLAHFAQLHETSDVKKSLIKDLKNSVEPDFKDLKRKLVLKLGAVSHQNTYQQSYPHILKLHVINEFEKAMKLIPNKISSLPTIFDEWEQRGQLVRASKGVEFVLGMRRAALNLAIEVIDTGTEKLSNQSRNLTSNLKEEVGKIWLKSAKIARKAGFYHQSYVYILSASDFCPPQELHLEQAQLAWEKGCQKDAFTILNRAFIHDFKTFKHYKDLDPDDNSKERRNYAKAKLLFAKYNDQFANVDRETNRKYYKDAVEVWKNWEKSNLLCAEFYESVLNNLNENEREAYYGLTMQHNLVCSYGKSLQFGCKYIHQSLPRMLTVWMNFAYKANRENSNNLNEPFKKMNKVILAHVQKFPKFIWLSAFSQLVSRICHPAKEVQSILNTILIELILAYPQQCLWMMASVINSSYPGRKKAWACIVKDRRLDSVEIQRLITHFDKLWSCLLELSNKQVEKKARFSTVNLLCKPLLSLFTSQNFSPIMMPTSKFFQLHLPQNGRITSNYNPLSSENVSITGIDDKVMVMNSLQAPKRISLRGSDGRKYLFMGKPKDDLRKDFRLMEFNSIVNKYLQKDPESRQRRLYIRTYSVVPLNEECGLIEWIPNLICYRAAITDIYKERKCYYDTHKIAKLISKSDPLERKREVFMDTLLPAHPAVFGDWFKLTFPDPYSWYEARTAYVRTSAVISMVGYILGLGDRHGENINLDSTSGDCVHVDFNCLFNHGETFDWPEKVPFRLTHNMVEAMGPLKYDGPFRRCCEITMRILRHETNTLMSVLTPFVYDPLVSWKRNQHISNDSAEKTNEKAREHIKNIEQRLKGFIRSQGSKTTVSLSVEGQVNCLIDDATNIDNLCQMWYGWNAFM